MQNNTQDELPDKLQDVILRFEDGTVARLTGKAFYTPEEMAQKDLRLSPKKPIEISQPYNVTDEVREQLIQKSRGGN